MPDPVEAIRVQVNGRPIEGATPGDIGLGAFSAGERTLDVPLERRKNEVPITLTDAIGEKAEVLTLNVSFREDAHATARTTAPQTSPSCAATRSTLPASIRASDR
jgi:hypothetical protein